MHFNFQKLKKLYSVDFDTICQTVANKHIAAMKIDQKTSLHVWHLHLPLQSYIPFGSRGSARGVPSPLHLEPLASFSTSDIVSRGI